MRTVSRGGATYRLASKLNQFQENLQIHLVDWKRAHITQESGLFRGEPNDAILPAETHDGLPHLYLPILQQPGADRVLRQLKPDLARIATEHLDGGFRIEFWDEPYGVLNDKTRATGTDADIAIAYFDEDERPCLWLIEHKLTEAHFTPCGGAKSKGRNSRHTCDLSFDELLENPAPCYYHDACGYAYWELTAAHADFFAGEKPAGRCPFVGGQNQLWRNQLLALGIESDPRQPFERATFSVVHHPQNNHLQRELAQYRSLTNEVPQFGVFTSQDVLDAVSVAAPESVALRNWASWYAILYRP